MEDLLSVAKELLEDFDLYGGPIQLRVIAKLRRAVENVCRVEDHVVVEGVCAKCGLERSAPQGQVVGT